MKDDPKPLDRSLASKTARGGAALVFSQLSKTFVHLVTIAVLARILAPSEFGLYTMTMAFVHFFMLLSCMGLAQASVQNPGIRNEEINALFWFNITLGLIVFLMVFTISPLVGTFYGEPRVGTLTRALSFAILIQVVSLQSRAQLERHFQFSKILAVELTGSLLASATAITLAIRGWGPGALVGQEMMFLGICSIGFISLSRWKPGPPVFGIKLTSYIRYGRGLTGSNLVNFLSRNLDNVLIGRAFGGAQLGFYQKAYSLALLPITQLNVPLSRVLLPALSQRKNNAAAFRAAYRTAIGCLSSISIPIIALMGVVSREIILVLLGEDWIQANTYFLALLPAAYVGAMNMGTGWVYTSFGHTGRQFQWSLINGAMMATGIFVASLHGVLTVALTVSGLFLVMRIPGVAYCFKGTPLGVWDFWTPVARQTLVCMIGAGATWLSLRTLQPEHTFLTTFLFAALKGCAFLSYLLITDHIIPGAKIRAHILFILKKLRN
jgi:PST family polysaccharide transporter